MGLDSVELVFEWEKAFDITIPDLEAEQITTVRKATEVVLRHVRLQPQSRCKSQSLFYQFRRYCHDQMGVERSLVRPETKYDDLLSGANRRQSWRHMQAQLDWTWPAQMNCSVRELIDYTFALNYEKLVTLPHPANWYEVEKVIMGITSEKMGIEIHEIKSESSFTGDLGID
jgi:acyl carrier protein